jgi:PIN domain nuclease of toxin-antitoxin system
MRLLLDTHSFLWFVTDDPQLSANAQALVADPTNEIVVSPASYWEVAIKVSIGKYPLDLPFGQFFTQGMISRSCPWRFGTLRSWHHCQCTTRTRSTG